MALRHSLWVRQFSLQDHVGFYEDIHTKQRRALKIMPGNKNSNVFKLNILFRTAISSCVFLFWNDAVVIRNQNKSGLLLLG